MTQAAGRQRRAAASGPLLGGADDFAAAVERHLNRPGSRLFAIRALVVEGDTYNLKLLRDLLRVLGHAVIAATDGAEAIALARRHRPDVVFVAVGPRAGPALDLRRRLGAEPGLAGTPVIALVDPIRGAAADARHAAAFDGAIPKPIPLTLFLEVLETLLSRSS